MVFKELLFLKKDKTTKEIFSSYSKSREDGKTLWYLNYRDYLKIPVHINFALNG